MKATRTIESSKKQTDAEEAAALSPEDFIATLKRGIAHYDKEIDRGPTNMCTINRRHALSECLRNFQVEEPQP